jgi:hypothetical protein
LVDHDGTTNGGGRPACGSASLKVRVAGDHLGSRRLHAAERLNARPLPGNADRAHNGRHDAPSGLPAGGRIAHAANFSSVLHCSGKVRPIVATFVLSRCSVLSGDRSGFARQRERVLLRSPDVRRFQARYALLQGGHPGGFRTPRAPPPLRQSPLGVPEIQLDQDLRRVAAWVRRQREALAAKGMVPGAESNHRHWDFQLQSAAPLIETIRHRPNPVPASKVRVKPRSGHLAASSTKVRRVRFAVVGRLKRTDSFRPRPTISTGACPGSLPAQPSHRQAVPARQTLGQAEIAGETRDYGCGSSADVRSVRCGRVAIPATLPWCSRSRSALKNLRA